MRVLMNPDRTAASPMGVWMAGQVVEVSDETGLQLIQSGSATLVAERKPAIVTEAAAVEPAEETAAMPPARKRRRKKVRHDDRTRLAEPLRTDDSDSGDDVPGDASGSETPS